MQDTDCVIVCEFSLLGDTYGQKIATAPAINHQTIYHGVTWESLYFCNDNLKIGVPCEIDPFLAMLQARGLITRGA